VSDKKPGDTRKQSGEDAILYLLRQPRRIVRRQTVGLLRQPKPTCTGPNRGEINGGR
jgi:hypothetical protein